MGKIRSGKKGKKIKEESVLGDMRKERKGRKKSEERRIGKGEGGRGEE